MKLLGVTAALAVLAAASPAFADDAACIHSYESTQTLRKAAKLKDARSDAAKCADAACPAVLVKDCEKWLAELDQQLPSMVFEVKSAAGEALTNVKVTANGHPLVDKIDGKPIVVDPGSVTLHFESPDGKGKPVDQTIVLKEGEKGKKVSVTLGSNAAPKPAPVERPVPIGTFAFAGAGIAALGVGTVFAVLGSSSESDLDTCKPRCAADDVNSVGTKYAVADILFSAGVVSLAAAAYIFITRPKAQASTTTGALRRRPGLVLEF